MVGTGGAVKVLDFGLAKLVSAEIGIDAEGDLTRTADVSLSGPGTVAGTAAYMSPEQATGAVVDARSDIFSFGVMLYEMVTAARPFVGKSTADSAFRTSTWQWFFSTYPARCLVLAQAEEGSVPQVAFGGPFDESYLCDELRRDPLHLVHLLGRDSPAPMRRRAAWKIDERAAIRVERLHILEDLAANVRCESGADLAGKAQVFALVAADEQRIDAVRPRPVSANDEFLLPIELQLDPGGIAVAGRVS
jgi:serine/threonine protein kinase